VSHAWRLVRTFLQTAQEVAGPSGQAPGLRLIDDAGRGTAGLGVVLVPDNPHALDRSLPCGTRPALDSGQFGSSLSPCRAAGWPRLAALGTHSAWTSALRSRCTPGLTVSPRI
jgi:hypothetical protein